MTLEKFIEGAPYVSKEGVTVGSKKITVFLADSKSGTVINKFSSDASPPIAGFQSEEESPTLAGKWIEELVEHGDVGLQKVELPLYIMRIDYFLQHFSPTSGKVLWNLKVADIKAILPCQGNEIGSEFINDFESPLHCQTWAAVFRIREPSFLDSLPLPDRLPKTLPAAEILPLPSSGPSSHLQHVGWLPGPHHLGQGKSLLALPLAKRTLSVNDDDATEMDMKSIVSNIIEKFGIWAYSSLVGTLLFVVGFVIYKFLAVRGPGKSKLEDVQLQGTSLKKKKSRKSGINKYNASAEKRHENILDDSKVAHRIGLPQTVENETKFALNFNDLADGHACERKIGKLLVSKKEIARGSNGTIVLEGIYNGRPVAVKRLVRTHHDVALKEIQNLIASDQHPNIVRWHGVEYDQDFVYLSLERCSCSLSDLMYFLSSSQDQVVNHDPDSNSLSENIVQLHSIMEPNQDCELWKTNGYPSPQLLKLMR